MINFMWESQYLGGIVGLKLMFAESINVTLLVSFKRWANQGFYVASTWVFLARLNLPQYSPCSNVKVTV